jgi:hypothetical protein
MRFLSRGHRATAGPANIHRYGTMADGSRNTIHASGALSIEVDDLGRPTAVWFRCLNLPFHTWHRGVGEAVHINPGAIRILNIEYQDKEDTTR